MRWIRRLIAGGLILLLVVVVAGAGLAWFTTRASFPQVSGTVTVAGLGTTVEVRRDEYGVPQITADTAEDLFMAQGYVHAQERFWEMDFRRHVTAGRLSELFGESQIGTDTFIRTMGWRHVAEQELALLSPESVSYLQAYAAGVNAYLADHAGSSLSLEYAVLDLQDPGYQPEPWTPVDSLAWLKAMAWNLSGNLDAEIQRVVYATYLSDAQIADLDPPYPYDRAPVIVTDSSDMTAAAPAVAPAVARAQAPALDLKALAIRLSAIQAMASRLPGLLGMAGTSGIGSNSFVVDGSRTTTGMPILANDPHLGASMPGIWMQMGLHCRELSDACPFDVSGFTFSGFPGVVLGHNDRIAWGFTNLGPDVQDLYLEDVEGDRYRVGDRMLDLDIRAETITVAGGDPVTIRVRSTGHGPLLSDADDWYRWIGAAAPVSRPDPDSHANPDVALQWTALQPGRTGDAIFLIDRARDFDDFRTAARSFEVPSQNMIYADVDGHIGYQAPGTVPIRQTGDGKWPVPGWDPAYDWDGFVAFDDMPWMLDPEAGYIVTANNAVTAQGLSVFLTDDWALGDRASRLVDLIEASGPLDVDGVLAIPFDNHGPLADVLAPALEDLPLDAGSSAGGAIALLHDWDGQQTADSAPAAFLNVVWSHLVARTFDDEIQHQDYFPDGGDRWLEVMRTILDQPDSAWWDDVKTADVVEDRDTILSAAVDDAMAELTDLQGSDPTAWRWGKLHTLTLRNETFGMSGIGPIEWLFNRGPLETSGGLDVLNATGWDARTGYEVDWVPSMRMAIDLSDLDASRYVNLTGVSGHAFHDHYDDQAPLWATGQTIAWPFSSAAQKAATKDLLTLEP